MPCPWSETVISTVSPTRRAATATLVTADADTTLRALLADGGLPDLEVRGATLEDAVVSLISSRGTIPTGATR